MADGKKPRCAGSPWRILVHERHDRQKARETGYRYGTAFHVANDKRNGSLPTSPDPEDSDHSKHIELPGTEFDELVVGKWMHLEAMDTGRWWMNIGGVTVWVRADRDGKPRSVSVYGPGDYAEPVDGCDYSITWDEGTEP